MKKATSIEMASILGQYVKRWQRWVVAGLLGITVSLHMASLHDKKTTHATSTSALRNS